MTNEMIRPRPAHRATPEMIRARSIANAVNFIVASLECNPEMPLSMIAMLDPYSADEFAADYDFNSDDLPDAIALMRQIRAQLEY